MKPPEAPISSGTIPHNFNPAPARETLLSHLLSYVSTEKYLGCALPSIQTPALYPGCSISAVFPSIRAV